MGRKSRPCIHTAFADWLVLSVSPRRAEQTECWGLGWGQGSFLQTLTPQREDFKWLTGRGMK